MLRFTERAVQALTGAEQLAWQSGQPRVEPTHLLLALLARRDSMACRVLAGLGVDLEAAASALHEQAPRRGLDVEAPRQAEGRSSEAEADAEVGRVPFSHAAKGVVERAAEEARAFGHRYVGTEHLLLALLAATGEPGQTLRHLGADLERARLALRALLRPGSAGPAPGEPARPSGSPGAADVGEASGGSVGRGDPGGSEDGPTA